MAIFTVMWNYKSSLAGPFTKGDQVEFDEKLAEAINLDSPGVLVPGKQTVPATKAEKNRMVTPENQGVMTRENFGAVKGKGD